MFFVILILYFVSLAIGQLGHEHCLIENSSGCELGRPPIYMITAPRRIRAGQVFQVFATILRMEYHENAISVRVSIVESDKEYTSSILKFERPTSRLMQLQMPSNAEAGNYKLRVEGRLDELVSGNIFFNETEIEFTPKHASIFIQMSKPIYRQEQLVHFRIIPLQPDLMPKYGNLIIYIEDPSGVPVKRWPGLQTNAGGIISQSFQLSDQPKYGTWHILVDAFSGSFQIGQHSQYLCSIGNFTRMPQGSIPKGITYSNGSQLKGVELRFARGSLRPSGNRFLFVYCGVLTFSDGEPRFDVNVSVQAYVMDVSSLSIQGVVLINHTSGRPCVGNGSITSFFIPSEEIWNATKGWEKPYHDAMSRRLSGTPLDVPKYRSIDSIPVSDYSVYFAHEYRFIDYYKGRINFEWHRDDLLRLAKRGGATSDELFGNEFVFLANITDWYSGLNRTGWAGTIVYDDELNLKWIGGNVRTFKPGSLFRVQVAVSYYDGRPVRGGSVTLVPTVGSQSVKTALSEYSPQTNPVVNGIANFQIPLNVYVTRLALTASYHDPGETLAMKTSVNPNFVTSQSRSIQMLCTKYYSPTNSYLSIYTSTFEPQVVAQNNIIIADELEMSTKQKTFSVALSREMVPTARVIVYYIKEPEEIVSDVLSFFVNGTRQNQVSLYINRGKDFSRNTVEFNAYADPGSYVAFSAMLLDLYSRGMNDGITENKLIDELLSYDQPANSSFKHLWRVSDTEYQYTFFHGSDYGIDGNTTFKSAGIIIITDADVTRLPNQESCNPLDGKFPCFSGVETECFTSEQRCNGLFDGCPNDGADEWGCIFKDMQIDLKSPLQRISRVMRYYDNSSWAWQEIFIKPDGRTDFRVDVPKYPLSWVINGISISQELGFGIMQQPLKFDASRFMYMQVEYPKYIVWGEQIGVRVTVFNNWYDDDYMEILVTMHEGQDIEFVSVGEMGYVTSYSPTTHKGDHQTIVFLEPGDSQDIYLPIVPAKSFRKDKLTFRVTAVSFMGKDEHIGEMIVKPNGVLNYYHTPYLIDLIRYPSIDLPQFKVNVPELFRKQEYRPNLYVPQSPKATINIFGDVVTPGFFESYLNAENLLYRPYGGGEMVTFNFAYNVLALVFMRNSNQLDAYQTKTVLNELNIALQRIYSYMNEDGSFKMFRDDDNSNLWLTAFVGKTLAVAGEEDYWELELYIAKEWAAKIVNFICSRQNTTTGAFEPLENEIAFDRKMASLRKMKSDVMITQTVPLTAYILIALEKMSKFVEGTTCLNTAKRNAVKYLQSQVNSLSKDEIFYMAITAYALSLTSNAFDIVNELWKLKRNDSDFTYFADQLVYENPSAIQNNVRYLMPRQELLNDAYSVQTTAYALLAHITANKADKLERDMTMTWLNTMRNSFGGFSSTQDTIVAIEALMEYTRQDKKRNESDMSIDLQSMASPGWKNSVYIVRNNFTQLYQIPLPLNEVFGYVIPSAKGVGRALLQLTVTSNVEYEELMKTQQHYNNNPQEDLIPFFDLQVEARWGGRNDSIMFMRSCISWLYTERSLTSGLAVLEVDMPTGYIVMNDTLRSYVQSRVVPNLKRAEFYARKTVFYFEYLDTSKTCVDFRADRWFPVANSTKEHRIRVYDYYEPGMHRTRLYTVQNLFLMNICFVCGSYQCPYCPYFNRSVLIIGSNWSLFVVVMYIIHSCFQ